MTAPPEAEHMRLNMRAERRLVRHLIESVESSALVSGYKDGWTGRASRPTSAK
jgi:hypothetical protein